MKQYLEKILKVLAQRILKRYQPEIIGITGSVGKSSTKKAISTILNSEFNVRESEKNYNNELGVPLTILGTKSANKSLLGWFGIFFRGLRLILFRDQNYPKILVLEMAADHPGDLKYLTRLARPRIGVVTKVSEVHLEFFGTLEKIVEEKQTLVTGLPESGWAVLNVDDDLVYGMRERTRAQVMTFGFSSRAEVKAGEMFLAGLEISGQKPDPSVTPESPWDEREWGMNFKLSYQGSTVPVFLPRVLGQQSIYAALAGAALGLIYGLNLVQISKALRNYQPPPGRMNLILGIKHTLIIDDTYNASPVSTKAALETVRDIKVSQGSRKFAVLGDMLELGTFSSAGHKEVGQKVVEMGIDFLVTVGKEAWEIARGAKERGFDENKIRSFNRAEEAGVFLQEEIKFGDLILLKGSQGMRLERVVEEIMAEPLRATELLVRQDKSWENR